MVGSWSETREPQLIAVGLTVMPVSAALRLATVDQLKLCSVGLAVKQEHSAIPPAPAVELGQYQRLAILR